MLRIFLDNLLREVPESTDEGSPDIPLPPITEGLGESSGLIHHGSVVDDLDEEVGKAVETAIGKIYNIREEKILVFVKEDSKSTAREVWVAGIVRGTEDTN